MGTAAGQQELSIDNNEHMGVIPRVLVELFRRIDDEKTRTNTEFNVELSLIEVYNEEIRDLFETSLKNQKHNIREENNSIIVDGLKNVPVSDAENAIKSLEKG